MNNNKKDRFFKKALQTLPKLQKEELIRLSETLISERALLVELVELNPKGVIVFRGEDILYQSTQIKNLLKECNNFIPTKNHVGIISLLDIHQKDRVLEIDYQHFDIFDAFYISDVTIYQKDLSSKKTRTTLDALENLAAGISHEIKNPLSAIDIHTQLIQRQINKEVLSVPPEIEEYLSVVQHESKRLLSVLDDFLNMTRKVKPILQFSETSDIILATERVFEKECFEKNIKLEINISQVPKIFTVPNTLQQVLSDLIRNAIEALENKDKKIIRLTLAEDELKTNLLICIEDSGDGISASIRSKVFEPYFTTKKTGTGLGLTLVNKMVHDIGGLIIISESDLGGAAFKILLPISQGQKKLSE
ncbi:MAG: sensor histidine kinase [Brevinema sp.]